MNKFLMTVFFSIFIFPVNAISQTIGSFSEDYAWQERFEKTLAEAKKDIVDSQYKVGELYEKGRGTPINMKQALAWFYKAAKQNHLKSHYRLGYLHYHGIGVPVDKTKAYNFLILPAQNDDVRAQYYLGRLYSAGQGVEKNSEKALSWYKRSSSAGYYLAEQVLSEYYSSTAKILQGQWMQDKTTPAEFLPSINTECKKQVDAVVECLSSELKIKSAAIDITYVTKALLFDIQTSGDFKVSYRTKIINFKKPRKENTVSNDAAVVSIKLGWQNVEHKLECSIIDKDTINCVKNKAHNIQFSQYVETPAKIMEQLVLRLE